MNISEIVRSKTFLEVGIEPTLTEPQSVVIPLYDSRLSRTTYEKSTRLLTRHAIFPFLLKSSRNGNPR